MAILTFYSSSFAFEKETKLSPKSSMQSLWNILILYSTMHIIVEATSNRASVSVVSTMHIFFFWCCYCTNYCIPLCLKFLLTQIIFLFCKTTFHKPLASKGFITITVDILLKYTQVSRPVQFSGKMCASPSAIYIIIPICVNPGRIQIKFSAS